MPLTEIWNIDGYRELAVAAVVDAFRVALKAKKVLYSLEHEDESYNTRKTVRDLMRRQTRTEAKRERQFKEGKPMSNAYTVEMVRAQCAQELDEIDRFLDGKGFALYTDVSPQWFRQELDKQLNEWIYEEERRAERERAARKGGR